METVLSTATRQQTFAIHDASQVASVRRSGSELARQQGFDETLTGKVAIAITEAATNILKHAVQGEILLRPLCYDKASGVEVIALDSGEGMSNISLNMQDGVSTAGSYGVGLGAMRRLSDEFDVYSSAGKGTVIYMAFWDNPQQALAHAWQSGVICLPLPGEEACGDAWALTFDPTTATVMVADGLGHGIDAARAAQSAIALLATYPDILPETALWESHACLRTTRGAAVAAAHLDTRTEKLRFAGIGNIAASIICRDTRRQLVSHNGIVGSNMRKVQEFAHPWTPESTLLLHTDGLGTRWALDHYSGLEFAHPGLIAAVLYRDFSRRRDDVTVLVLRERMVR